MMKNRFKQYLEEKITEFIEMYKNEPVYDYDVKLVLNKIVDEIENGNSNIKLKHLSEKSLSLIPDDLKLFYSINTFDNELLDICTALNKIEGIETFDSCIGTTYQLPGYIKFYVAPEVKEKIKSILSQKVKEIKIEIKEKIEIKSKKEIMELVFEWKNLKKIKNYKKREEEAIKAKKKYFKKMIKLIEKEFKIKITKDDKIKFLNKLRAVK